MIIKLVSLLRHTRFHFFLILTDGLIRSFLVIIPMYVNEIFVYIQKTHLRNLHLRNSVKVTIISHSLTLVQFLTFRIAVLY